MKHDLAAAGARRWPDRPAVWANGRWHLYAELNERASRLAARLRDEGLQRGQRVAVLAQNHLAHIDLLLAAPKLGVVFAPFNYRLTPEETRALSGYVRPDFLFLDPAYPVHAASFDCTSLVLSRYESWLDQPASPLAPIEVTDDETHMLLFTGGSTGTPKAACIPYRQIAANNQATVNHWGLDQSDCAIQATPCFHAALNVYATPLLSAGGRVVLMPQFEASRYLQLVEQQSATRLFMVPTMFQMLAEARSFASTSFASVRGAVSGGAPCPIALRERFAEKGVQFAQGYGMTEAGVNCFVPDPHRPDSVGRPMPGLEIVIRHVDGSACLPGEVGEITLRGPQVCAGYFEREAEWLSSFRDGWLWSGDLAQMDANGCFHIVGRRKEMFISGGENVYPTEVEAAIASRPEVAECAVIGVPHPQWGEVGLAAISLKPGAALDAPRLSEALRPLLAGYKRPREFLFMPALPKTGAGKYDKPAIRRAYEAQK